MPLLDGWINYLQSQERENRDKKEDKRCECDCKKVDNKDKQRNKK
jgi:hypothetical protein